MDNPKIYESEYQFCLIIWEHEPITAVELAKLCLEQLGRKRTTTYTVIKRLCERGILRSTDGVITSSVSKEEAQASEIDDLVEKRFGGSLPAFITAFTKHQNLTDAELEEIQRMIDRSRRRARGEQTVWSKFTKPGGTTEMRCCTCGKISRHIVKGEEGKVAGS